MPYAGDGHIKPGLSAHNSSKQHTIARAIDSLAIRKRREKPMTSTRTVWLSTIRLLASTAKK